MEKYFNTYCSFAHEGGVVKISDEWFIWGRCQSEKEIVYKEIPSNMELITRNLQGYMEEVKIVKIPYMILVNLIWMILMMRVIAVMMMMSKKTTTSMIPLHSCTHSYYDSIR